MPDFDTLAQRVSSYYGSFPGPTRETYDRAVALSKALGAHVTTPGVVGIGYGRQGWYYAGLSPKLESDARVALGDSWLQRLTKLVKQATGSGHSWVCARQVDPDIVRAAGGVNPGCAEKKILTQVAQFKDRLREITVVEHPYGTDVSVVNAHLVVGSGDGIFIAPCESCLQVGETYCN